MRANGAQNSFRRQKGQEKTADDNQQDKVQTHHTHTHTHTRTHTVASRSRRGPDVFTDTNSPTEFPADAHAFSPKLHPRLTLTLSAPTGG